jgi:hypothetical protein
MRSLSLVALLSLLSLSAQTLQADDKPAQNDELPPATAVDRWMQIKLSATQSALANLTKGDFVRLERDAGRLLITNILEKWLKENEQTQQSAYQGQLNAFEFAVKELQRHSRDHNTEGALQAFLRLNESCVRCHMLIRDQPTTK